MNWFQHVLDLVPIAGADRHEFEIVSLAFVFDANRSHRGPVGKDKGIADHDQHTEGRHFQIASRAFQELLYEFRKGVGRLLLSREHLGFNLKALELFDLVQNFSPVHGGGILAFHKYFLAKDVDGAEANAPILEIYLREDIADLQESVGINFVHPVWRLAAGRV